MLRKLFYGFFIVTLLLSACAQPTAAPVPTTAPAQPTAAPAPTTAPAQPTAAPAAGGVIKATPGQDVSMVLLPKFLGNAVFDEAHAGAEEAAKELQNPTKLQFLGPTPENSVAGQIEIVTNATTQGVKAIMISNNAGDQLAPAVKAARAKNMTVVTWDSPIPSAEGEQVFIAQVDFDETGKVMAQMALDILGADGGKFAILSASADAANQNAWIAAMKTALADPKFSKLQLLDVVYGNDQSEASYKAATALVDKYPDMKLIMAPTSIGITAAAKALTDLKLCDKVKVSGLGLPSENAAYVKSGCTPEFALWSFVDLGYLTYYATYLIATGAMKGAEGEQFAAGRMGNFTITKDPTRKAGLRVLMGPFSVYNKDNIDQATGGAVAPTAAAPAGGVAKAKPGNDISMVLLPKFLGNAVFDEAHAGAEEAAKELANPTKLQFLGPTPENSVAGQIEIVTNATTQGVKAIMISNNAGDQLAPAVKAARAKGMTVVTWDSPIPSGDGEQVFIAQVDFNETGKVMAQMALDILGADGGKFAILSASADAANQNAWIAAMKTALADPKFSKLQLLDVVYGNDQSEASYKAATALVDKYPDMKLIMAPTSIGITAAAKALTDLKLCDKVKVSGLGLVSENAAYLKSGCTPEFALWSFPDLGYLTYYTTYLIASGDLKAEVGAKFEAGRMGTYTIEKDPTRANGLRVLMGPFTVYNKDNIDQAMGPSAAAKATPGKSVKMVLLPKFLGNAVFDEAHAGAEEAAKELQNPEKLQFLGPTPENSVAGQIEIVTNATTQGVNAIMISNNAGDQLAPAVKAARAKNMTVVTWDSPIPSAEGEQVFIAQVDFDETGKVMAQMALDILGADGGKFAILSASADAANQNAWIKAMKTALADPKFSKLQLLDVVYGNDQSEASYKAATALVDKYPDMKLIMAPTSIGITAAAKALTDLKLCDKVKVSGLGLPSENAAYVKSGCTPEFALWSFVDLGYLTYYATYMIATGAIQGKEGEVFDAGRMGKFTITKDPTRAAGLRVLMGPFSIYNKDNIDKAVKP